MEILKHGSHVEVLEPEWLCNKFKVELNQALSIYRRLPVACRSY